MKVKGTSSKMTADSGWDSIFRKKKKIRGGGKIQQLLFKVACF